MKAVLFLFIAIWWDVSFFLCGAFFDRWFYCRAWHRLSCGARLLLYSWEKTNS